MRRHVAYYTHLFGEAADEVEARFRGDPAVWLPAPGRLTDDGWLVDLCAEGVLLAPLARHRAELLVSPPAISERGERRDAGAGTSGSGGRVVVRAVSWHSTQADRLFPVFAGELELAPLPVSGHQLSLAGVYRPPLSVVGAAADQVLGHRVAEACVRRFVLDVGDRLAAVTLMA